MTTHSARRWVLLLTFATWSCALVFQQAAPAADPPAKGYKLHEWGVFTAYQDVDVANAELRTEWESMPKFFYGQTSERHIPSAAVPVNVPVIYFHAAEAVELKLRVEFPAGGMPAVWWPATAEPATVADLRIRPEEPKSRILSWHLRLKQPFRDPGGEGRPLQKVDKDSWVNFLRDVKADDVHAWVGGQGYAYEREKFVFYDGFLPHGKWAEISFAKDQVTVRNRAKHALFDFTAVDLRPGGAVRVASVDKLEGGAEPKKLEFREVAREKWPTEAADTVTKQLVAAGLHEDEATALIKVWEKAMFRTEGLTVFYRLPQEEYERLLPMTFNTEPTEKVRIGLVLHPHCEPDLAERVATLVKDMESVEFDKREQAQKKLEELGRPAMGHLLRLRNGPVSLDLKQRLNAIVEKYESARAIPVGEKK